MLNMLLFTGMLQRLDGNPIFAHCYIGVVF